MHDFSESMPEGFEVRRLRIGSEELVVVSVPSLSSRLPGDLTSAERSVLSMLLDGLSSLQIARQRGTSVRTVANQAAAIFRKLGVHRRAQLAHALAS
jgi:DNA-binding NarL/FixJ family response regulator